MRSSDYAELFTKHTLPCARARDFGDYALAPCVRSGSAPRKRWRCMRTQRVCTDISAAAATTQLPLRRRRRQQRAKDAAGAPQTARCLNLFFWAITNLLLLVLLLLLLVLPFERCRLRQHAVGNVGEFLVAVGVAVVAVHVLERGHRRRVDGLEPGAGLVAAEAADLPAQRLPSGRPSSLHSVPESV